MLLTIFYFMIAISLAASRQPRNMAVIVSTIFNVAYDIITVGKRGTARPPTYEGGDNVTILEVLALLNLIAVVVFGVINASTKK